LNLSTAQRIAIRHFKTNTKSGPRATGIANSTVASLLRRRLIEEADGFGGRYKLTAAGERAYNQIMASGDGPEGLKALFRS
jgi:hypothetical protein